MPDFCTRPRVLAILGMAQLVVILVALWPGDGSLMTMGDFLSASAFSIWVAIAVAVLLCRARQFLSGLRPMLGMVSALALSVLISAFAAGIVYGLYTTLGEPPLVAGLWRFVAGSASITVLITALVLRYFYVSERWTAQLNANARAEADALQARIRPHFLFNSMNLIASLVRRDPEVAEKAVLDLSDLFRAALGAGDGESTLVKEMELAKNYLSIESLRLGDRLQVEWKLDEPLPWATPMPHLILQPLVENAVLHGISRLPEGGAVKVGVSTDSDVLIVSVSNPAPSPDSPGLPFQVGNGHAQKNIAYRLSYRFGARATLERKWHEGHYSCEVRLPLR